MKTRKRYLWAALFSGILSVALLAYEPLYDAAHVLVALAIMFAIIYESEK